MKKIISLLLTLLCFNFSCCGVLASNNIRVNFDRIEDYQYKTVLKHYKPYSIGLVNDNDEPVLFNAKSQIKYIDSYGKEHIFTDNKTIYRKSRKRDVGRYCWVTMPSALVGGGVIGITFGLGLVLGVGIAIAGFVPTLSAMKYNSKIATNIYIDNKIPLSLEPKQYQMIYVFVPIVEKDNKHKTKDININQIIITNLSIKNKQFDLTIPVVQGAK